MPKSRIIDHEMFEIKRANSDQESMWDGYKFGNYSDFAEIRDDFFDYLVGQWVQTLVGSSTATIADAVGGQLALLTGATEDDAITIQRGTINAATGEAFLPAAGKTLWFECRAKISDATQSDFIFGFVIADTTPISNTAGIYFRKDDGDTNIDFESNSTTASTATNIATCDTSFHTYGFKVNGTSSIDYWFDGVKKGSITSQIPTTEMKLTFQVLTGEGAAKTLTIDYFRAVQER